MRLVLVGLLLAGCSHPTPVGPAPTPVAAVTTPRAITGLVLPDEVGEAMAAFFQHALRDAEDARKAGNFPPPTAIYLGLPGHTDPDGDLLELLDERRLQPLSERPWQTYEVWWTIELERMEWKGSENDIVCAGALTESKQRLVLSWTPELLLTPEGRWVVKR